MGITPYYFLYQTSTICPPWPEYHLEEGIWAYEHREGSTGLGLGDNLDHNPTGWEPNHREEYCIPTGEAPEFI